MSYQMKGSSKGLLTELILAVIDWPITKCNWILIIVLTASVVDYQRLFRYHNVCMFGFTLYSTIVYLHIHQVILTEFVYEYKYSLYPIFSSDLQWSGNNIWYWCKTFRTYLTTIKLLHIVSETYIH